EFVDDITGWPLNKALAIETRKKEIEYFRRMGVYTKIRREKWMKLIDTKWIDQNKGDARSPSYRARLVGREIKRDAQGLVCGHAATGDAAPNNIHMRIESAFTRPR
ncbi:MAG: hypothetical protein QGH33_05340, partial [Pirellulaceae bacterium]|nr:hypothetical protein [Pirellulaceae bacterium]